MYAPHHERRRFRPVVDQLEDRSVPTTSAGLGHAATQFQLDHSRARLSSPSPTTLANVIIIARNHAKAVTDSVKSLRQAIAESPRGSLSRDLLTQRLQVTQTQLTSLNQMIRSLVGARTTAAKAFIRVFQMQANFADTNARLQAFQIEEILQGYVTPFV